MNLEITVDDESTKALLAKLKLTGQDAADLNARVATQAQELTRTYLGEISRSRHDSARRLGAAPTGFWGAAVESVSARSDSQAATIGIRHPGIGRAMHDVTITPGSGKKYLTIPVNAAGYGRRASEVAGLVFIRTGPGKTPILAIPHKASKTLTVIYALVPSVRQKQDRTLLPSDEGYEQAGAAGVRDWLDTVEGKI